MKFKIVEKKTFERGYFNKYEIEEKVWYRVFRKWWWFSDWELMGGFSTFEKANDFLNDLIKTHQKDKEIDKKLKQKNKLFKSKVLKKLNI